MGYRLPGALNFKALTGIPIIWKGRIPDTGKAVCAFPPAAGYEILEDGVCFSFVKYWCQAQCLDPASLREKSFACMTEEKKKVCLIT